MKSYSIAQAEGLSGIKAGTLRIWEKRYGFLIPERTSTKIRYYNDDQIKILLNVSILINAGHKISKIAQLSRDEIFDQSLQIQHSGESEDSAIKKLTIAMMNLDEQEFDEILRVSNMKFGLVKSVTQLIYPFLNKVGILWGTHNLMPAHEHFISHLITRKIIVAIDLMKNNSKEDKKAILFLPPGHLHEIGLLLSCFIFKSYGWTVYYLGPNVPLSNVAEIERLVSPDILFTLFILPGDRKKQKLIDELQTKTKSDIWFSGDPSIPSETLSNRFKYFMDPNELVDSLKK